MCMRFWKWEKWPMWTFEDLPWAVNNKLLVNFLQIGKRSMTWFMVKTRHLCNSFAESKTCRLHEMCMFCPILHQYHKSHMNEWQWIKENWQTVKKLLLKREALDFINKIYLRWKKHQCSNIHLKSADHLDQWVIEFIDQNVNLPSCLSTTTNNNSKLGKLDKLLTKQESRLYKKLLEGNLT